MTDIHPEEKMFQVSVNKNLWKWPCFWKRQWVKCRNVSAEVGVNSNDRCRACSKSSLNFISTPLQEPRPYRWNFELKSITKKSACIASTSQPVDPIKSVQKKCIPHQSGIWNCHLDERCKMKGQAQKFIKQKWLWPNKWPNDQFGQCSAHFPNPLWQ